MVQTTNMIKRYCLVYICRGMVVGGLVLLYGMLGVYQVIIEPCTWASIGYAQVKSQTFLDHERPDSNYCPRLLGWALLVEGIGKILVCQDIITKLSPNKMLGYYKCYLMLIE